MTLVTFVVDLKWFSDLQTPKVLKMTSSMLFSPSQITPRQKIYTENRFCGCTVNELCVRKKEVVVQLG